MAILGIRNLNRKAVKPRMKIRLTNDKANTQEIMIDADWSAQMDLKETSNPNFGTTVRFDLVSLARDPLCWPYIEI